MVVENKGMSHSIDADQGDLLRTFPVPLAEIPYLDFPELKFNDHESTEMPFRYVKGDDGKPIMPKVRNATYKLF